MATKPKPKTARPLRRKNRPITVDWHTHVLLPEAIKFTRNHNVFFGFKKAPLNNNLLSGGQHHGMVWEPNAGKRIKIMDKVGIDVQVISSSNVHQCCDWAPARDAAKVQRILNDGIAELVASKPDRFVGIATVPLQSVPLAIKELDRAVGKLGLRGVSISSTVEDTELDDPRLYPFWTKVQELDIPIYVHPAGAKDDRLQRYFRWVGFKPPDLPSPFTVKLPGDYVQVGVNESLRGLIQRIEVFTAPLEFGIGAFYGGWESHEQQTSAEHRKTAEGS